MTELTPVNTSDDIQFCISVQVQKLKDE